MTELTITVNENEFQVKGFEHSGSWGTYDTPAEQPHFEVCEIWYQGVDVTGIIDPDIDEEILDKCNEYALESN